MDGRKAAPRDAANGKAISAAKPAIGLDRAKLLGSGDRTSSAKIGDGKGGGGGGGAPIRDSK